MSQNLYLFDLDNTLANIDHRLHYLDRDEINWREFEEQCTYDLPIASSINLARRLVHGGGSVWIWTGRSDHVQNATQVWLHRYDVPYSQLIMKPKEDDRGAAYWKKFWLDTIIPRDRLVTCFEDDNRITLMLREQGVDVMQVRRHRE